MNSQSQRRLVALEKNDAGSRVVVILRSLVPGGSSTRIACRGRSISDGGPQEWIRLPGETAENFRSRAVADAQIRMTGTEWPVICLREYSEANQQTTTQ